MAIMGGAELMLRPSLFCSAAIQGEYCRGTAAGGGWDDLWEGAGHEC